MTEGSLTGEPVPATEGVLFSVLAEHLDEAEFQLERFAAALSSPVLGLAQLAELEEWVFAHVDALAIGGRAVAEHQLFPLLGDEEGPAARVQAAALALVASGAKREVFSALEQALPTVAAALGRGLHLADDAQLDEVVRTRASSAQGDTRARWLTLAADRGVPLGPCHPASSTGHAEERLAAVRASDPTDQQDRYETEQLLGSADEATQSAALVKALTFGSYEAWRVCRELAERKVRPHPLALGLVAGLGDPSTHEGLIVLTAEEPLRYAIVRALGYSGNIAVVPWLLGLVGSSDERAARLAAEAIRAITGAPVLTAPLAKSENAPRPNTELPAEDAEALASLPPLHADDLDADLVPPADDSLPKPDAAAMEAWWAGQRSRFDPRVRYLGGLATSLDAFRAALATFPLAQRHLVALLLGIRTGGSCRIDTRRFARSQRAAIASIPPDTGVWPVRYSGF